MDALLAALLSALLTVIGTGLLHARRQARQLEAQADRQLAQALAEFGFALDALILELQQLPPTRQRAVAYWQWVERRVPSVDFLVGRLARALFGRDLYAAIERMQKATNKLMLIAPPAALEALEPIFNRLSTYAEREDDWFKQLQDERAAFANVCRTIVSVSTTHPKPVSNRLLGH